VELDFDDGSANFIDQMLLKPEIQQSQLEDSSFQEEPLNKSPMTEA